MNRKILRDDQWKRSSRCARQGLRTRGDGGSTIASLSKRCCGSPARTCRGVTMPQRFVRDMVTLFLCRALARCSHSYAARLCCSALASGGFGHHSFLDSEGFPS